jgi:hypothetical protein
MLPSTMEDDSDAQGPPVELSEEETAVMLGHFAGASFSALSTTTGIPLDRVETIVGRLSSLGLIDAEPTPAREVPPPMHEVDERASASAEAADDGLVALLDAAMDGLLPSDGGSASAHAGGSSDTARASDHEAKLRPAVARRAARGAEGGEPATVAGGAGPEERVVDLAVDEPNVESPEETREYQKLYETELHPKPTDERVALAGTVTGAQLFALCFDPEPPVIRAIFQNTAATVEHARLVAFHHRTVRGLDELVRRTQLASDPLVHRRLVRNPALDEAMLRRLLGSKRLLEVYKVSLDRDVPERSRVAARNLFRTKFTTAQPEERVDIIWSTEGRALVAMSGLTFDSRTTTILCSRNYASIMLIMSLARFPATPPMLISHLLRQPLVKRQAHLKNQLLSHPNTPSDAKRRS